MAPLWNALDDVEALAWTHVAEGARLPRQNGERGRPVKPVLEPRLVGLELLHDGVVPSELAARVDVRLERTVIEKRDEQQGPNRKPAAKENGTRSTATFPFLLLRHAAGFDAAGVPSCTSNPATRLPDLGK
jgi:hypothetical protein